MGVVKMASLKHPILIIFVTLNYLFLCVESQDNKYFLYMDPLGVMVNFTGQTEGGNIPHGFGQIKYANGDVYIGETRNRIRNGFGSYSSITGDKFIGQWKSGHKNGFGITTSWLGHSFLGANLNDNLEGYGILTVTDGTKYVGKYANNDPHGIHEVTFLNGTRAMAAGSRGPSGLTWRLVDSLV